MATELQTDGVQIFIFSCSNPIHKLSFLTMIIQQICLKNKEYYFMFTSNGGLENDGASGKMMG